MHGRKKHQTKKHAPERQMVQQKGGDIYFVGYKCSWELVGATGLQVEMSRD